MATGLRERKKQATRIALSWAAVRLVVERGYDAVRVEDIADEAGVSLRTFRNYFSSKAEAIAARHYDRVRLIADEVRARPADEPLWTAIVAAVEARISLGSDGDGMPTREWLAGVRLMISEPALQGELFRVSVLAADALAAAVAERTGIDAARDVYPRLVAAVVGAALGTAMEHWVELDPPVPFGPLLREVFDRVAAGLPEPIEGTHHDR